MRRKICGLCPKLELCENDPKDCDRNNSLHNLVNQEMTEIIEDLHHVFTQIEVDGDE